MRSNALAAVTYSFLEISKSAYPKVFPMGHCLFVYVFVLPKSCDKGCYNFKMSSFLRRKLDILNLVISFRL